MAHAIGQMLGGRYEILDVLKPGAQGEVYKVCDHHQDEIAVLKLFDPNLLPAGPWAEAQALNKLADDHILPIRNADLIAGQPFIVTQLAEHGTLEDALSKNANLGLQLDHTLKWVREACTGVARAHDAGLVHNDIKPANLFLGGKRQCLVGDFGLASTLLPPPLVGIAHGASPETAAPEVCAGWASQTPPASRETDVYSLGATAFWLLAGEPPVDLTGITGNARFATAATQTRQKLRDIAPHVPAAVAAVIDKALSVDPTDRYATVNELSAALGSRSARPRSWLRTDEHASHLGCWRGTAKGKADHLVCLEQGSTPKQCMVTGRYNSGKKIPSASRSCTLRNAAQAVRATIDRLS
jgi:serine/threonine protein kinase